MRVLNNNHQGIKFMNKTINLVCVAILASLLMGCGKKSNDTTAATTSVTPKEQATQSTAMSTADLYEQAKELYSGSKGVVDKAKAFELFSKGAELGDGNSMFFVGVMYDTGEAGTQDEQKALEWFEKSDKAGCGAAAPWIKKMKAKMAKAKKK
jgi:hypothetical protein